MSTSVLNQSIGPKHALYHADTIEVARGLPSDSIDFSVFSPPFASLYTYSASDRDMGNVRDHGEFWSHYRHLVSESMRVMKPGRLIAAHCMDLPTSKVRDGRIGLRDFPGDLIREYERAGFIYHSRITIWKDPVTAMQRTKALGLLHKQIRKDSSMSRQGIPDVVIVMRKPGPNPDPVAHTAEEFPVEQWQRWASPVWVTTGVTDGDGFAICLADINPSDTLQYRSAREEEDEKHICPLQLEVIRRCVRLWTNPGDVVWSPFAGIGSEGVVAIEEGRRFVGAELKCSYYQQAARNLAAVDVERNRSLFGAEGA